MKFFLTVVLGLGIFVVTQVTAGQPFSRRIEARQPRIPVARRSENTRCPVCDQVVPLNGVQFHIDACLLYFDTASDSGREAYSNLRSTGNVLPTMRAAIAYGEEELKKSTGDCSICLEEMAEGDLIARLPCFCIYHKNCIEEWFGRKSCCPEHPDTVL